MNNDGKLDSDEVVEVATGIWKWVETNHRVLIAAALALGTLFGWNIDALVSAFFKYFNILS